MIAPFNRLDRPMRHLLPVLSAAVVASAATVPVMAGTPFQTPAPATASAGVSIEAVRSWLTGVGAVVGEVQRDGPAPWIAVADGEVQWMVHFYGCQADVCDDIQFSARAADPSITLDRVNAWNRDQRFLKAFYVTGSDGVPSAVVQYDVLLTPGAGVAQLNDPAAVWIEALDRFLAHLGQAQ